jgi:hypothetical protein
MWYHFFPPFLNLHNAHIQYVPKYTALKLVRLEHACTFADGAQLQRTRPQDSKGSCAVQLPLETRHLTEERVFTAEHYFRSYGSGHEGGLGLKMVAEQFREGSNKTATSNAVTLYTVSEFRRRVLCQWKGKSGRPVTVSTKENHARVLQTKIQRPLRGNQYINYAYNNGKTGGLSPLVIRDVRL